MLCEDEEVNYENENVERLATFGFFALEFKSQAFERNPFRYTIGNAISMVTRPCNKSWLSELKKDVKNLGIQRLYLVGMKVTKELQISLKDVYVYPLKYWYREICPRCPNCKNFNCSKRLVKFMWENVISEDGLQIVEGQR